MPKARTPQGLATLPPALLVIAQRRPIAMVFEDPLEAFPCYPECWQRELSNPQRVREGSVRPIAREDPS